MRRGSVNDAQELQKLLVAMTQITGADHGAVEYIERSEQTGGAVALVVVARIAPSSSANLVVFDPTLGAAIVHPRANG